MVIYFLDTSTLSLLQRNNPTVSAARANHGSDTVAITTVNVEEVIGGWFALLRRVKSKRHEALAAQSLAEAMHFLSQFPIFSMTEQTLDRFDQLVRMKLNVGKMDLRIAALALEYGATDVTNNIRDFGRVPGLSWEDWSV